MLSLPVLTMEYKDALVSGVPAPSREALKTWLDSLEYETLIQPRERGPLVRTERLDTKMAMHMVQLSPGIQLDKTFLMSMHVGRCGATLPITFFDHLILSRPTALSLPLPTGTGQRSSGHPQ